MATVRVFLRQNNHNGEHGMEEFEDAKARIVNGILQVYRSASAAGSDEEIIAEFHDTAYLYWRYFD